MEFLVSMTTHVPDGTAEESVDEVRRREAAHSAELIAGGRLLRLWRPPVQPGEWRTLGLFAADDSDQLEETLASMPLRVWRKDDPTPLFPHPNDPGPSDTRVPEGWAEYLTALNLVVPEDTPPAEVEDADRREAERARDLSEQGHLVRLWKLSRPGAALGLWRAPTPDDLEAILNALPLAKWLNIEAMPLTPHPSDPLSQAT